MRKMLLRVFAAACCLVAVPAAWGQVAGKSGTNDLVVATGGQAQVVVVVSKQAGEWEKKGADDLAKYIGQMTGGRPAVLNALPVPDRPAIVVGSLALELQPGLRGSLANVAKKNPVLRTDAIVLQRAGNRVYLAGTNDDSHYYAVSQLLHTWGCRWYLPTEFGECIPQYQTLKVGDLNESKGSVFECRKYWIAWNGDYNGKAEFTRRNFMNDESVPNGHCLATYTKEVEPKGKGHFNIPITDPRTAQGVAKMIKDQFNKNQRIMLGIEDGLYESDYPRDKELLKLQYDKYFLTPSYTDCFMTFYNNVAEALLKQNPNSTAKIGFLAYANLTLPPIQVLHAAKPLVAYLAPIDIDPVHGMDSPHSGPRKEYKDMLYKWAKVMDGRLVIYDYDQSMLVWRDLPNPSHQAFREDVKHYAKAGILGIDTESRGAMATIFLNLFFRGQLMWNPDASTDQLLEEFYPKFYGPAAKPMANYWNAIFKAWEETLVTEHEYFVVPGIYTPELIASLQTNLATAEKLIAAVPAGTPSGKLLHDRLKFTRLAFGVLDNYVKMIHASNTEVDYKQAAAYGKQALALREQLTNMNGTFTTYRTIGEHGSAWFPGEVKQYEELVPFTDGTKGTLLAKFPLVWNYRRDPQDVGVKEGWLNQVPDLSWWKAEVGKNPQAAHVKNQSGHWEEVRTDMYLQAQGLVTADYQSYSGHGWYRTEMDLSADQTTGKVMLKLPGVFNEFWIYVNGQEVVHRPFKGLWWLADYKFEFETSVAGKLKPGKNVIVIRHYNPHHFGGLFRRPFLYRAK